MIRRYIYRPHYRLMSLSSKGTVNRPVLSGSLAYLLRMGAQFKARRPTSRYFIELNCEPARANVPNMPRDVWRAPEGAVQLGQTVLERRITGRLRRRAG